MRLSRLLSNREYGKNHSQRRFRQPNEEPARRTGLMRGDRRGGKRGETDSRTAPAWNRREGPGALHRFANKAKIIRGAIFQGNENGARGPSWFCRRHEFVMNFEDTRGRLDVKFFARQSRNSLQPPRGFQPYLPTRGTNRQ